MSNPVEAIEEVIFNELVEVLGYIVSNGDSLEDASAALMEVFLRRGLYIDTSGIHEVEDSDWITDDDGYTYRTIYYRYEDEEFEDD